MNRSALMVALVVVLALLVGGATAFAKTINVPADYATIQAAIDAAATGDVVMVAQGTYKECINFRGKAITVQSTNPADKSVVAATVVNGQRRGSVVSFKSGEPAGSVLSGFTITNGKGTNTGLGRWGGGVYCERSSPTLTNNRIVGNTAGIIGGGGVSCLFGGSPTVTGNTIAANSAEMGGGVCVSNHCAPTLANNIISNNSAYEGGGVYCEVYSPARLTSNTITGNAAGNFGGGVMAALSAVTMTGNAITGNKAVSGGGGVACEYHDPNRSPRLSNNVISGNSATGADSCGGGLTCMECDVALANNVISGNSAAGSGGGVACRASASATLTNNTISGNSATNGGGVSCAYSSSPVIRNTIVSFSTKGGGLYVAEDPSQPSSPAVTYSDLYGNAGGNYVDWPNQTDKNGNISRNPLFADAAGGDFHEKSKGGRWSPATKRWVVDAVHSPCVDAGDPESAFGKEPAPNGGRINMGAYGDTRFASKSTHAAPAGALALTAAAIPTTGGLTQITVNLTSAASVQVSILNLAGREVVVLPKADLPAGVSSLLWNGRTQAGTMAPAGRYLVRVTARTEGGGQAQALAALSLGR